MSYDTNLAKQFRDIAENIGYFSEILSNDEDRVDRIDDNDWSIEYMGVSYKLFISIVYFFTAVFVYDIVGSAWWINAIVAFIALAVIEAIIIAPIIKSNAQKRIQIYKTKINKLTQELDDLLEDKLLPEIYPLGMMTATDIIDKTSARYLPLDYIEDFMNQEVRRGNFTKVKLKNDILYKGLSSQSAENIETFILEID